jgi:DNA-binding cell septation regulator SpoVG
MASQIKFKDLISHIDIKTVQGNSRLMATGIMTIADAFCINFFINKNAGNGQLYINWPGHKSSGDRWFNDAWPKNEVIAVELSEMIIARYESQLKGPKPIIDSKIGQRTGPNFEEDPFK